MTLTFLNDRFICRCSFDERHLPKKAGFRWDTGYQKWVTTNPKIASRLAAYADESAKTKLNQTCLSVEPWAGPLSVPKSERLYSFQETAARFALARNNAYLGLDPGLGKTPVAAVVAATLKKPAVYICPPFLTRNAEAEFKRWAPELSTERYSNQLPLLAADVLIVPDSILTRDETKFAIASFVKINRSGAMLIVDEAHRYKNELAARTKSLFNDIAPLFDRTLYLSGTPMPNRPIELFSVLNHSASELIDGMSMFQYARKYCAAHQNNFGWDYSGASNLDELGERILNKFMLRMKKSKVLKELPPKTEELVLISDDLNPKLAELDSEILKHYSPDDLMEGQIRLDLGLETLHLATYRRELGLSKVNEAIRFISYLLEDGDENLLVFAIHTDVIDCLKTGLAGYNPLVITGSTPMEERHAIVKEFQTPEAGRRLFIGNIQAAGTGLTLTRASRVVFAEYSWVPADNDQASDRAHRIGQVDNVHVQYLVFQNSVDRAVIETILKKRKITARI